VSRVTVLLMVLLAVACGSPASGPRSASSGDAASAGGDRAPGQPSRLAVAIAQETGGLATKLDTIATSYAAEYHFMTNSPLTLLDAHDAVLPRLAQGLVSQDDGTWRIDPDGTMRTTWTIRSGALWHDGSPVTAADFAFALRVYQDPEISVVTREPEQLIDHIDILDDRAFVVAWSRPYAQADRLGPGQLEPLPEHLLAESYERDRAVFQSSPFWTGPAYVGNGPYQLTQWEQGVQLIFRAFDRYYLGKPSIDEITFHVISDPNTVVANLLSGSIDATVGITLPPSAGAIVRETWDRTGDGRVLTFPTSTRFARFQLDPARSGQPALLDKRVRQAVVHALDRDTIAGGVSMGMLPAALNLLIPENQYYERVRQLAPPLSYDRSRALALLGDAGWTRSPNGAVVGPDGQPLSFEIRTPRAGDNEPQMNLVASDLRAIGIDVTETLIPAPRLKDLEYMSLFPGLYATAGVYDDPTAMENFTADQCPRADARFVGKNVGCWINTEYDRLVQVATTSLDDRERTNAFLHAHRLLMDDVAIVTLTYVTENIASRAGLAGPGPRSPAQKGNTWDVHTWRWTRA